MIHSITITKPFETGEGAKIPEAYNPHYALPSLRADHVLDTDSNLVVIIGDNGSGKTTLLKRINFQYQFIHITPENVILDSDGEKPFLCELPTQLSEYRYRELESQEYEEDPNLPKYSQGEYRLARIRKKLSEEHDRIPMFDQPEDGVALRRRQQLVDLFSEYAFEHQKQVFVATHEPRFLSVPDAIVINLDDYPASACKAQEFDLEGYLK